MTRERALIRAMAQVETVSNSLHTTSWVWGGLMVDIYQGHFLREHHDIDYLTRDLYKLSKPLKELYQNLGWQVQHVANGDLMLTRERIEVHLGNVTFSEEACWTHNGELGSIYFPVVWINGQPKEFLNLAIHVVEPELQFVLLTDPKLLNPKWVPREKDIAARIFLRALLEAKKVRLADLRNLVHN